MGRTPKRELKIIINKLKKEIPEHDGCTRCGECCGPVRMTPLESERIMKRLTAKGLWPDVAKNIMRTDQTSSGSARYTCPLLIIEGNFLDPNDRTTSCMVHDIKPIICRLQAFIEDLPCRVTAPKNKFKRSKWVDKYLSYLQTNQVGMKEELMAVIRSAVELQNIEIAKANPIEIGEYKMGDHIDEQANIDNRIRENKLNNQKQLVNGDDVKSATKVIKDSGKRIEQG